MPENVEKLFENVPEHPEAFEAKVSGTIPSWVRGTLLRNGPGIFKIGNDEYNHLFDGLAIVQRYYIENGQVEYSTKYVRSDTYETNMRAQRIVVSEFGTMGFPDPCKSIFQRYFSYFFPSKFTDNDSVNFLRCGDEIYASTETGKVAKIDPKNLDTVQKVDMEKYISVNTVTAHPHYDADQNMFNMGSRFGRKGCYNIIYVPKPDGSAQGSALKKSQILASIPAESSYMSYYHSFGMSQNHFIFPEMPLLMNLWKMVTSSFTRVPFSHAMQWYPDIETKFHILDSKTGEPSSINYTGIPCFMFHHINAYETDDVIVMDACVYLDGAIVTQLSLKQIRNGEFTATKEEQKGLLRRFVFPRRIPEGSNTGDNLLDSIEMKTQATAILREDGSVHCTPETLFEKGFELPVINYSYNGKAYRYCYAAATSDKPDDYLGNDVVKFDVEENTVLEWSRDHSQQFASEPIYVSKPGATEEDDGVLLVAVTSVKEAENNFLLVLDAKNMTEIARAEIEPRIPVSFHGIYLPQD